MLERIVYNHLIDFVNCTISTKQFGFLRNHSTLQQLLIFVNTVNHSLNSNSQTDVVYLDFKKAFDYHLNSKLVATKTIHPDLGVAVSSDLQWKSHYLFILPKSYKILGLLRRVFSSVNCVRAKKVLYLSLVRSKLLYCSPIWRPHLLSDVRALENVQRRATKFILNDSLSNYRLHLVNLK